MKKKNWTGERLETHVFDSNTIEHLHRYAIASQFAKDKEVLDLACGEGYGSNLLSRVASNVIGVDIAKDVIRHASQKYKNDRLKFLEGAADQIPLEDNSVDLVVSFETIEHHDKHHEMFIEIKRVLKKSGVLIMSSPNKLIYTDQRNYCNSFHIKELYEHEFKTLVNSYFEFASFLNQRALFGSLVYADNINASFYQFSGDYNQIKEECGFPGMYLISIASDEKKIETSSSVFNDLMIINHVIENVKNSRSYRLGNFLLSPFRYIKRQIK